MTSVDESSLELFFLKTLESLVLPPGLFVVLIFCALIFSRQKMLSFLLFGTALLVYATAVPATRTWLSAFLKSKPFVVSSKPDGQAIVVLGGGRHIDTPEYAGDTINQLTLERLRYAAYLQKQIGLPILVSGGTPFQGSSSEAELMRDVLNREFLAQVNWTEAESRTTFENAQFTARILRSRGIDRIILVTHAYHMPRSMEAFEHAGFEVTPAATIFLDASPASSAYLNWIPGPTAAYWNSLMLHELIGRLWYHIRYYGAFPGFGEASG